MRERFRQAIAVMLCWFCAFLPVYGQHADIEPIHTANPFGRPWVTPEVPPVRISNSARLRSLIRAGTLYLTTQDAIALALENNLDIEVARYNPLISRSQLVRFEAGGALPGVPSGAAQAGTVASGQGVAGSQAAVGVSISGATAGRSSSVNATISQVGPVVQTLDPIFSDVSTFSHTSIPQPNTIQSQVLALISNTRVYNVTLQQGYLLGGAVTANYTEHYLNENAPSDLLNPSTAPNASVSVQQNLLNGFGFAVNSRNIRVSKINLATSDLNFRTQLIGIVGQVLNLYYGLAADYEDQRAKRTALDVARQLYRDTSAQVRVGTLAPLDQTTAESQVAASERDLVDSETALAQQEVALKNVLSRTAMRDPLVAAAHIVPVDPIVVPEADSLPPVDQLVRQALASRTDLASEKAGIQTSEISSIGTKNGLLPTLGALAGTSQAGLSGVPRTVFINGHPTTALPYFVGGIDTGLGQMFRRDFPTNHAGAFFVASIQNRQAQADFGIDQIQLRQSQLSYQKDLNQVQVDVTNYVIAMRQARARYDAAVRNVTLSQQLLDAEQKKLALGASTPSLVIQQQRDLANAQSTVIGAEATYISARVALDQALGTTLEANHVAIDEARTGVVARVSVPVEPPAGK